MQIKLIVVVVEIRKGAGGRSGLKKKFLGPSVVSLVWKIMGRPGPPGPSPGSATALYSSAHSPLIDG